MKQTQNSITRPDYIIAALLILIVGFILTIHATGAMILPRIFQRV